MGRGRPRGFEESFDGLPPAPGRRRGEGGPVADLDRMQFARWPGRGEDGTVIDVVVFGLGILAVFLL